MPPLCVLMVCLCLAVKWTIETPSTGESEDTGETGVREPPDRPVLLHSDPYPDPYYDYEMEALWRGGHYENFRVQYTEGPLPYHYSVSVLHLKLLLGLLLGLMLMLVLL